MKLSGRKNPWLLGCCLGCIFIQTAGCVANSAWILEDPLGDDHGPGSYRYPDQSMFAPGSFDLRRVIITPGDRDWQLEVEFAAEVKKSSWFIGRDERRELFVQTVDLYFRFPGEGEGHLESLPERGVQFAAGQGWHRAVVISPTPVQLRRVLSKTSHLAQDSFVPLQVRVSGRRLRTTVPSSFFPAPKGQVPKGQVPKGQVPKGQVPKGQVVAVLVTGTTFSESFKLVDRIRGEVAEEGLVMEVERSSGECRVDDPKGMGCHFSGCDPCGGHPRVIDLLAPSGVQEQSLSSYDAGSGKMATLPVLSTEASGN